MRSRHLADGSRAPGGLRGTSLRRLTHVGSVAVLVPLMLLVGQVVPAQAAPGPTDLSIVTTASSGPVNAGQSFTYSLLVTNPGPNDATTLVVADTIPAAFTLTGASSSDPSGSCTVVGQVVNCTLASLLTTGTWTITVNVTADTGVPGATISNTATVTSPEDAATPLNNTSSLDIVLNRSADLSITKTDSKDPVNAGEAFTYTIVVTNNGPDVATLLVVADPIPAGLTLTGASSSDAAGACTSVAPNVNCTLPSLAALATWTVTVNVTADASNPGGTVTNVATVAAAETDPFPVNNTASQGTTVTPSADLRLTIVPSSSKPAEGKDVSFVLTVTNNGPSPATNVVVNAQIPQDLKFVSAKSPDGKYNKASGKWTIPSISAASSSSLTIIAQPRAGTSGKKIVLRGRITASDQIDPTSLNNIGVALITVQSASGGGGGGGVAFTGSNVGGVMAVDLSLLILGLGALIASASRRRSTRGLVREVLERDDMGNNWAC